VYIIMFLKRSGEERLEDERKNCVGYNVDTSSD
jgi:hypothetical protein